MKKNGILNSDIASVLSYLGHTDRIIIADAGLPVPNHIPRIDLAVKPGLPSFLEVLDAIRDDMHIEKIILAEEIQSQNPKIFKAINQSFETCEKSFVSHEKFKKLSHNVKAIIRTGEITPFANIILQANVFFAKGAK